MVAVKKFPTTRADLECRTPKAYPDRTESKPQKTLAGFIFVCSNDTLPDLKRKIFGLPAYHEESVRAIRRGMPLFLFNYTTRCLCGVFEAASDGGLNLDPYAWENTEVSKLWRPVSRYPAQVRVRLRFQRSPLEERVFHPVVDHFDGHKFRLDLTAYQVQQLLKLFHVPEREFFGERSKNWFYSTAIGTYDPESPRSAFKSDSDCYSECSSKGTYCGEDEWTDDTPSEDRIERESTQSLFVHDNSKHSLRERLSRMTLSDVQSNHHKFDEMSYVTYDAVLPPGMPFMPDGSNTIDVNSQQTTCTMNPVRMPHRLWSETFDPRDENQMLSRFHEADPAVNSSSIDLLRAGVHQPLSIKIEDDAVTVPLLPAQLHSSFLGVENVFYIPVPMQPREFTSVPIRLQRSKGSEERKLSGHWLISKQSSNLENIGKVKDSRHKKPHKPLDNQQHPPIQLQDLQFGKVWIPSCAQRQGPVYDQNHTTTVLSPVFVSPHGQCLTFAQPQVGVVEESEGHRTINGAQLHPGGLQTFLQSGHFPIMRMPSIIPRMLSSPSPMAAEFVEALHFDILLFARLTRPSAERQLCVKAAIDCVGSWVKTVWPDADVEVFGSFATGLCLQHSDVDLAVVDAPLLPALVNMSMSEASAFLIRELGSSLKSYEWCKSYNVLATASVPILKCYCQPIVRLSDPSISVPLIAIDITIGGIRNCSYEWNQAHRVTGTEKGPMFGQLGTQHTGGAAREYVLSKIRELPALAPLVLLLKSFLHHKGLSNVYLGGLGSFSLTLLLAYYLERVPLFKEVSDDGLSGDSPVSSEVSSPLSCMVDLSEDFEIPSPRGNLVNFHSSQKAEFRNWSLGEHYVRRAADVIEKVLALWDSSDVPYLGTLLLDFLQTFGFELDLACEKIVLKGIDGSPGGISKRDSRHIALWIDDPLCPGVNVGAGSFGMCYVQGAFRDMLQVLINGKQPASPLHCSEKDCQDLAVFGQLSQLSQLLAEVNDYQ